ncbi:MAG: hypothetical protein LBD46_05235 [Endomicrobium sp.]|jgi:predicted nuclease with TOPRIM domain|nr:hypothetical protein [Endomicrobium sp.]
MDVKTRTEQLKKSLEKAKWEVTWHREHLTNAESDVKMFEDELARLEVLQKAGVTNAS